MVEAVQKLLFSALHAAQILFHRQWLIALPDGNTIIDLGFAHFASANAAQRSLRAYDPDATTALVQRSKALFTPAFFAERAGWGDPTADPIFIVGLPRSGSTLVEQILASHRKVQGLGERPVLAMTIAGRYPLNPLAPEAPDHFRRLAQAYLATMHQYGWKNSPRTRRPPNTATIAPAKTTPMPT